MNRTQPALRHQARAIHELMTCLVQRRLARAAHDSEADARRELWQTLREHAGLDDPNRLDRATAAAALWVLTALLELEPDAQAVA